MGKWQQNGDDIEEAYCENEQDYLFTRKADEYLFVIYDKKKDTFELILETQNGPKKGFHFGEIRVARDAMRIVAFKLMTLEPCKGQNPYDNEDLLARITGKMTEEFDDISLLALELSS